MWGKFGEVIFQLVKTPQSLNRLNRAKFSRISIFKEKEKLHFTGLEPEQVEMSINFHYSFCNPAKEVEKLKEYLEKGESYLLIIGDYVKGKFVIEELREEVERTDKNGNPLKILVNLILREDGLGNQS
ncbi:Phage protein U [Balnearium lithotrophicum]|uniref:Phage protein U n=1 Tax=Balnearium lithotrophicum TaxID=223788 RepID=A0A521DSD1_9BACT|nr:phage tail protein [Balnearium lithotrophicum]SMO74528.1 Phage protein U [Balnearium lithotrophicum]